ncbi:MAG: hypothetical protein K0S33_3027 [Bacteroidetes bacterium]|jgi:hypothetical protein|nr:hypothetical protein [Bacteroidota bacterium]
MTRQLIILLILFFYTASLSAQKGDQGSYKISRAKRNKQVQEGKAKLIVQFIGPNGKPVTSQIKFAMNTDSVVPVIDETGTYSMQLKAAKYKFNFVAPTWWYSVPTDSIRFKAGKVRTLQVRFEAKEYPLKGF